MVSLEKVIFEYLNQTSSLKTLIGSNLFIDRTNTGFNANTSKGLMFRISPVGESEENQATDMHRIIVDFWCYGGNQLSWNECRKVYEALHDRIHGVTMQSVTSGMIMSCLENGSAYNILDDTDGLDWLVTLCKFEFTIRGHD